MPDDVGDGVTNRSILVAKNSVEVNAGRTTVAGNRGGLRDGGGSLKSSLARENPKALAAKRRKRRKNGAIGSARRGRHALSSATWLQSAKPWGTEGTEWAGWPKCGGHGGSGEVARLQRPLRGMRSEDWNSVFDLAP